MVIVYNYQSINLVLLFLSQYPSWVEHGAEGEYGFHHQSTYYVPFMLLYTNPGVLLYSHVSVSMSQVHVRTAHVAQRHNEDLNPAQPHCFPSYTLSPQDHSPEGDPHQPFTVRW